MLSVERARCHCLVIVNQQIILVAIMAPKLENRRLTAQEAAASRALDLASVEHGPAQPARAVFDPRRDTVPMVVAWVCLVGSGLPRRIVARILLAAAMMARLLGRLVVFPSWSTSSSRP